MPRAWIRPIVPNMDYGASILLMADFRPDLGGSYRAGVRPYDTLSRCRASTSSMHIEPNLFGFFIVSKG
ncbi:conserved hypothetical protein [Acidithiobacillus ferrivorans]|uniref:Uncharacterized protein n=1 Tax=Acidithiobacillus ferrivorans TaxID=160808 RepID=A0A060UUL8_9PROT|nr:conserved hypothetical protein [Acidithiobacillus ferrivorans]